MLPSQRTERGDREKLIAEAAYFRAERRAFHGGDPVADWIEAEREVETELERAEHGRWLDDLEGRLAATGAKLKAVKKTLSTKTAEARKELDEDVQKLAKLRDSLQERVAEMRAQGVEASHKGRQRAEKLWVEISETINRLSTRKSKQAR